MKKLTTITIALIAFLYGQAQAPYDSSKNLQKVSAYGNDIGNMRIRNSLWLPQDTILLKVADSGAVAQKNGVDYYFNGYYWVGKGGGGSTVSNFSAGNMAPFFTTSVANSTTTPALSFALTNSPGYSIWGRGAGGTGVPAYNPADSTLIPDLHSEAYYNTKYLSTSVAQNLQNVTDIGNVTSNNIQIAPGFGGWLDLGSSIGFGQTIGPYSGYLNRSSLTGNRNWYLPDQTGTIALTTDIPAQFNPIAGTGMGLTGTYPNITFNATGGGGGGINLYNSDSVLSGNRTLGLNGYQLNIVGSGSQDGSNFKSGDILLSMGDANSHGFKQISKTVNGSAYWQSLIETGQTNPITIETEAIADTVNNTGTWYTHVDKSGSYRSHLDVNQDGIFLKTGAVSATEQLGILSTGGIRLPATTDSTTGVIFKGSDRFIHSYQNPATSVTLGTSLYIGRKSGNFNFTGASGGYGGRNTAIGDSTLFANTTGYGNVAIGIWSLAANTSGFENLGIGRSSLFKNTIGWQNTAVGAISLQYNTTGQGNTAMGVSSLQFNITGERNTAIGVRAMTNSSTSFANVAVGLDALSYNTTADHNVGVGLDALYYSNGTHNVAVGDSTLWGLYPTYGYSPNQKHMGYKNTAIGSRAGYHLGDTYPNFASVFDTAVIFLGANASRDSSIPYTTALKNMIVIGYDARGFASNQVVLGNDEITTTLLRGNVGIGTTAPSAQLHTTDSVRHDGLPTTAQARIAMFDTNGNLYDVDTTGLFAGGGGGGGPITLNDGQFFVGNASNVATGVTPTGDVTFNNTGVFAIGATKVLNSMIANSTIDLTAKVTGILPSANGGTGINNSGRTLTINTNSGTIDFTGASKTLTVPDNASVSGTNTGDQSMATLSDVSLTGLANGDFLKYNGSAWINRTAANVRTDLTLVPGTDVQAYDGDLAAVAGLSANGIIARTASNTMAVRTLTGTTNKISITNGDGVSGNPTFDVGSDIVQLASTQTLSNKRWVARVGSTTSSATPTINTDNVDIYKLTAQTANITSFTTNLTGTPNDGDILEIQITGTAARTITWGASFVSSTVTLPATTVTTATLTVILQWFTTSSYGNNKWVCVNSF